MHNGTVERLRTVAGEIEAWREERGLSKAALCKKFGHLGSTKTYGRIIDREDDLKELDPVRQLDNYEAVLVLMQSEHGDPEDSKVYTDFEFIRDGMQAVINATRETGNNRLVLVTGERG